MIGVIEKLKIKNMMNLTVNEFSIKNEFPNPYKEKEINKLASKSKAIKKKFKTKSEKQN